eukprot:1314326-Pleurochrysis_carterae.AAC.1
MYSLPASRAARNKLAVRRTSSFDWCSSRACLRRNVGEAVHMLTRAYRWRSTIRRVAGGKETRHRK